MYEQIIPSVAKTISGIFLSLSILFGTTPQPVQPVVTPAPQIIEHTETIVERPIYLGANISSIADFRTSLNSGIDNSTTTMTLVSFVSGSDSLIIGETYGFKIGGREYVLGTAAANNKITGMTRGLSRKTATTTFSSYIEAWGRGTAVEITDAPLILDLGNKLTGKAGIDTPIRYDTSVATTTIDDNNANLVNYELLTYTAFNGAAVINASLTQKGLVEVATQIETASSTSAGSTGALLAIPASNATSTYNSATAPLRVVVTKNDGFIDPNFLNISSYTGNITAGNVTITGSSNIASTSIYATTTTGTWTKPANLRYLIVEGVGGGGGSSGCTDPDRVGGGGGGGGYFKKIIRASDIGATETVTVGSGGTAGAASGGTGGTGGTTSFGSHTSATGGVGGETCPSSVVQATAGGVGSNGSVNLYGGYATFGIIAETASADTQISSGGGNSMFGVGAPSIAFASKVHQGGASGIGYGAGASGIVNISGSDLAGSAGTPGIVIFTYVFY